MSPTESKNCVLNWRGGVCRALTSALIVISALFAGSSSLHAAKKSEPLDNDRVPEGISASDWQGIWAAHEAWKHAIEPVKGGWQARNPAQQWTTTFDGRGFEAKPQGADWTWGLELRSYGAGDEQREVGGAPPVKTEDHRLAYHWDDTVQEWYVNDGRGLEHGFSVQERPPGPADAPLTFVLATRGPLRAAVTRDARAVDYRDKSGTTVLTYSGLRVWDADGRELDARFVPAEDGVTLQVDANIARYPLLIDPIAQQAYLKEPGGVTPGALFGHSVAVSGNTAVVGAPNAKTPPSGVVGGVAHVYVRNGSAWTHQAVLTPSDPAENDLFGMAVAISGDTVMVGAPQRDGPNGENDGPDENRGAAYVFFRNGSIWSLQAEFAPSDADTLGAGALFGASVSVSGHTAVVGAPRLFNALDVLAAGFPFQTTRAAYVFVRAGTTWSQQARLPNPTDQPMDGFGESVCVEGDTLVVGAPRANKRINTNAGSIGGLLNSLLTGAGTAHVFVRSGQAWNLQTTLLDPNPVPDVGNSGALFGTSVSLSGETLVVGARGVDFPDSGGLKDGAAYVFTRSGSSWQQQAQLVASNFEGLDEFGAAVAVSGDIIVVGARGEDGLTSGIGSTPNDPPNFNTNRDAGAAYLFTRSGTAWTQRSYLKASNAEPEDAFGFSVAMSGNTWLVGAPQEDGNGTSPTSNTAENAGAAYAFFVGPEPVITSASSADGRVGSPFAYQITSVGGTPSSFDAAGLPSGLVIDRATGLISGTPEAANTFPVVLSASNTAGSGTANLVLKISPDVASLKFLPPRRTARAGKTARFTLLVANDLTRTQDVRVTFTSSNPGNVRAPDPVTITARGKSRPNHGPRRTSEPVSISLLSATIAEAVTISATAGDQTTSTQLTVKVPQ